MSDHIGPIHTPTFRLNLNDEDKAQLDRIEAMLERLLDGEESSSGVQAVAVSVEDWKELFRKAIPEASSDE